MTFKDHINEVMLIADLMTVVVWILLVLWGNSVMAISFVFIFLTMHIVMKYQAMAGWTRSNAGWGRTLRAWNYHDKRKAGILNEATKILEERDKRKTARAKKK